MKAKEFRKLGYSLRSGLEDGLQMNFEKEKDMKETNLQHYKEDLKEILKFHFDSPRYVIKLIRKKFGCQIEVERGGYATNAILDWMAQPYKEPILDEAERKYLSDVIRPFRKEVATISKFQNWDNTHQYIYIALKSQHYCTLPFFPKSTMYKGMENGKHYSLEELGL